MLRKISVKTLRSCKFFQLALAALIVTQPNVVLAALVYDRDFGVNPVFATWSATWNSVRTLPVESSTGLNFTIRPSLKYLTWDSKFRTKWTWAWGSPSNPAEGVFYLQDELDPFASLSLYASTLHFGLFVELPLDYSPGAKLSNGEIHNLPLRIMAIDLNFPRFAFLAVGNDIAYLSIGRYRISWGSARYPVHISPTAHLDNATFGLRFGSLVYTFHAIASYPLLSPPELNIQRSFSDSHTAGLYFSDPSKSIFAHRLDLYGSVSENFSYRFGIGELNIVGGKFPDLIDLNPVVVFHNTYGEGYSNVTGGIDFTLKLWKVLRLYGELVFDDLSTLTESLDGYKPGALAFNLGGELRFEHFTGWVEYAQTSQWMYVTNYLPYLRVNVRQFAIENDPPGRYLFDYPLGFKYGPEASLLSVGFEITYDKTNVSLEYAHLSKGLVNDGGVIRWKWFWDTWPRNVAEPGATTPQSAGLRNYSIFSLTASWDAFWVKVKTVDLERHLLSAGVALRW